LVGEKWLGWAASGGGRAGVGRARRVLPLAAGGAV